MNFLNIVIQGYCNENNREHLADYFFSEFKKAEKEIFCSTDLFFGGCIKVIEGFNRNLKEQVFEQQRDLNQYLISVGANKDEIFVNHLKEQIEYQKLNGNTNFRLENGTMLRLSQKQITDIETAITYANSMLNDSRHSQIGELPKLKKLNDIITHQKSIEIVENIKIQYKNIKGKQLKILLLAIQELGLFPKERSVKKFYDYCKNEFDWDIASYNAMNGYSFNEGTDKVEFDKMIQFLEKVIKTE